MPVLDLSPVECRRAIEALRSGVPNRDAVRALGSSQSEIEALFRERLEAARGGGRGGGLLIKGDFGVGKSHLLQYLQHVAADQGFVTSKIVISKETPLHDPARVFRTAIDTARVPGRRGTALKEIADDLRFESPAFHELRRWVDDRQVSGLDDRFSATLYLLENARSDLEFADRILRFWGGDRITVGELRRELRMLGEGATYALAKITSRDLALQRFRFAARLMTAAGYAGWVLLFDEVELIGRYSLLQRARAYGEVARWVDGFDDEPMPGITSVLAITEDFDAAVIDQKNDLEKAPNRLRAYDTPENDLAADRAEHGMNRIVGGSTVLRSPDAAILENTYRQLREIHGAAYAWRPPEVKRDGAVAARAMRQYVRAWINEWDLRRLDPSYEPEIEIEEIGPDSYAEDPDLDQSDEDSRSPAEAL